eukprot:Blabericola_migrator_1__4630@NODE_2454_length_2733_cov_303_135409_g1537_i0_p1_GENE_NODE_2454_length_2733_cov_303_135409_g1537_i0NODE_2454_length_2733_cov_303_135409_g1537_i0_p1_ORF_typecomplete_len337_score42_00SAM_decarbox/PF01536_16/4_4e49_NODE_2454_length_2733_cov_303_135409_g1537_i08891899
MSAEVDFEGVEKRLILEVEDWDFLKLDAEDWEPVLTEAQCAILSWRQHANRKIYLLSESTLLVWKTGILLKTCGRTSPLKGLTKLLELYPDLKARLVWLAYTRLDFLHPEYQYWPHQNFEQEFAYVRRILPSTQQLLLPAGNHTFHVMFHHHPTKLSKTRSFEETLLLGIRVDCVKGLTGFGERTANGCSGGPHDDGSASYGLLRPVFGDSALDEFWFQPQGYSCNALTASDYFSCHISPEPMTSYASLEKGYDEVDSLTWGLRSFESVFEAKNTQRTRITICPSSEVKGYEHQLGNGDGMCCVVVHTADPSPLVPTCRAHNEEPCCSEVLSECHV